MIILGTNSIKDTGYDVANSARFENSSSDYLNRTPSSASNRKTFTFSFWVKRTKLGTNDTIYNVRPDSNGANRLSFHSTTDTFRIALEPIGKYIFTTRKFRDVSAWYHIVAAFDTTQGTASDRVKIYINGVQEGSLVKGDGGAATYPDENTDLDINRDVVINIGRDLETSSDFIDMYLAEFVFIDGQQLAPTSFGEFDEDSGIWKPIDVSGLTFGTNGFYLDFENSGSLGADVSGNGNNFTVNNLTAIDQTTDTCTNNFVTLNPLAQTTTKGTVSQGNLEYDRQGSTANWVAIGSTIGVTTGKWYYEYKVIDAGTPNQGSQIGFVNYDVSNFQSDSSSDLSSTGEYSFYSGGGNIFANGSSLGTFEGGYADGDIIMVAIDLDNSYAYWGKNGSWINSGDPTSGSSGTGGFSITGVGTNIFAPAIAHREDGNGQANFGNPPFTISSGNTDGNGYGNFEYAVPSGYYSLNTKNLAEYG